MITKYAQIKCFNSQYKQFDYIFLIHMCTKLRGVNTTPYQCLSFYNPAYRSKVLIRFGDTKATHTKKLCSIESDCP